MSERLVAMGVDGCKVGWVAARLWRDGAAERTDLGVYTQIAALAADCGDGTVVAIDIPIGLADVGPRTCDVQVRKRLGRRGSSVFPAPARWMLAFAGDYAALRAHVAERRQAGETLASLSAQGHGIVLKIKEVDDWLAANPTADSWLLECHPEISFMALNGARPIAGQKKTAEGKAERRACIAAAFPDAPHQLDLAAKYYRRAQVAIDDLHDAYACLHSAAAAARGEHDTLGDGELDRTGRPMRIITAPL